MNDMQENAKQNRVVQMLRNLGIYAVGGIGSRLMTFLLVPIYSFFIAPSEFGYYDICFAVIMLMLPFLSMQLRDGAFRFLLDAQTDEERTKIVTFSMLTMLRTSAACVVLGAVAYCMFDIKYMWHTVAFGIVFAVFEVVQQMLRGLGHNKLYAGIGILTSFLIFSLSVPLVIWADMGVEGVFAGNILARLVALMFAEWRVGIFSRYIRLHADVKATGREILRFSYPLIVVNLIVIFIASGNRFFIEHFLGLYENGLYAVAVKFACILEALTLIVNQTWQETAIRQYADADRDSFYSKIFNTYLWFLVIVVVGVSYVVRFSYGYIVGSEYQESVWLVYPLVLSSMLLSLLVFYDVAYQCSKQTSRQLPCLVIALFISIASNYFFSKWWGLYGILASINVTYIFMLIYKVIDTRRYMLLTINYRSIMMIGLLILSGVMYYVLTETLSLVVYFVVACAASLAICPKTILDFAAEKLKLKTAKP